MTTFKLNWKEYSDCYVSPGPALEGRTMYDFHDSTDTLKFWTEILAMKKTFYPHDDMRVK